MHKANLRLRALESSQPSDTFEILQHLQLLDALRKLSRENNKSSPGRLGMEARISCLAFSSVSAIARPQVLLRTRRPTKLPLLR